MQEEKRIKRLASETLTKLGHDKSVVICPKAPVQSYEGEVGTAGTPTVQWTIRATDDQHQTCLIELLARPEESDQQIGQKLMEQFSTANWKRAK